MNSPLFLSLWNVTPHSKLLAASANGLSSPVDILEHAVSLSTVAFHDSLLLPVSFLVSLRILRRGGPRAKSHSSAGPFAPLSGSILPRKILVEHITPVDVGCNALELMLVNAMYDMRTVPRFLD